MEALQPPDIMLKTGGTITVIEGDHGSAYFHPESQEANRAIDCLGGSTSADERQCPDRSPVVSSAVCGQDSERPRCRREWYTLTSSKPGLVDGFTKNTFNAMVEGVKDEALKLGLIDAMTWGKGNRRLIQNHSRRWDVLLHILQSHRDKIEGSREAAAQPANACRLLLHERSWPMWYHTGCREFFRRFVGVGADQCVRPGQARRPAPTFWPQILDC